MRGIRIPETNRARELRRDQTSAEARLWRRLRNRALNGFKFVRQEPVGAYFADFVCREKRLIVEIDGATHSTDDEVRRDEIRTKALVAAGYRVVRSNNVEVYENIDGVLETILAALEGRESL